MRTPLSVIRLIGLLLCGVSVLLTLETPTAVPGQPVSILLSILFPHLTPRAISFCCLLTPVMIGGIFLYCTSSKIDLQSKYILPLLTLQTLLALVIAPELQFIVAVEAGLLLSPRLGSLWIFAQTSFIWLSSVLYPQLMSWVIPATSDQFRRFVGIGLFMLLAMLYNFFAFALGWLSASERRQSRALDLTIRSLERANNELIAAQNATAETARLEERLFVARELHDAIGHQLTALSVNLQVASRLSQDRAQEHIREAYQLAGELLSEVRSVVSTMRDPPAFDFAAALSAFALRLEQPKVHLSLTSLPDGVDRETSHTLLRCAKEIITNAVRHADAQNLWIATRVEDGNFELDAKDDGHGQPALIPGNGLTGIFERIDQIKRVALFQTEPDQGFRVTIRFPLQPEEA